MTRTFLTGLLALAFLAGCPTAPKKGGDPEQGESTPGMDSNLPPPGAKPATSSPPASAAEPKAPVPRPLPPGVTAKAEVQRILRQSFDWLDAGQEDKARVELEQANLLEPDNKQVSCLLRGITTDPHVALGSESTPYIVRPGDTLATIAKRFMGDVCEFYILARYNDIKIPKQLSTGQTIRLPGKVAVTPPPPTPPPPPPPPPGKPPGTPTPKPVEPKPVEPPPKPVETPKAAETKPAAAPAVDPKVRAADINRRYGNGRAALTRQDLSTAIREFDAVLAMDPSHNGARVYRQQAIELQAKLNQLPPK